MSADQTVRVVPMPDFVTSRSPSGRPCYELRGWSSCSGIPRTLWFMANKLALLFKLTPSNEVNRQYALISLASYGLLLPFMGLGFLLSARRAGAWGPSWRTFCLVWPRRLPSSPASAYACRSSHS